MIGAWRVSYVPTTSKDYDRSPIITHPYRHRWSAERRRLRLVAAGARYAVRFYKHRLELVTMSAPDIEQARCVSCGYRRVPLRDKGRICGWRCPNCQELEEIR